MKTKAAFIVLVIMVVLVLSAGSLSMLNTNPGMTESRKILVMRSIGHQLLKSSGDSTSRVMPVRKLNDQTFLIEFENNFAFLPDSLVRVADRVLSKSEFPAQYAVHVMNCADRSIVYGFEMLGIQSDNAACLGRKQPVGCYAVQITFSEEFATYDTTLLTGCFAIAGLGLIGFVVFNVGRKRKLKPVDSDQSFIPIGSYQFYPETGLLAHPVSTIELSRKETSLLKLFAQNPNELLLRDRLLKEVWEDEGVVTGRSLDMFVSKLRKKLQHDTSVNLVSVHGKGYRLEV